MEFPDYGVSRFSVVPVRRGPSHKEELVTQLLFGEHYEVIQLSEDRAWVQVRVHFDNCTGWIEVGQHHGISKDYFEQINLSDFRITTDLTSNILYRKSYLTILIGSVIPITTNELFKMEEQLAFNGDSKSLGLKRGPEFVKEIAFKYLNAPYLSGGKSPFGIDAGGYVQMVMRICGYNLPREPWQQASSGKPFVSMKEASQGDLVFFKDHDERVVHVGILLNDDRVIHSSGQVKIEPLGAEGIRNSEPGGIGRHLAFFRRVLAS
jgi:hypothetical protein